MNGWRVGQCPSCGGQARFELHGERVIAACSALCGIGDEAIAAAFDLRNIKRDLQFVQAARNVGLLDGPGVPDANSYGDGTGTPR
jgi:hypothetical protein